MLVGNFDKNPKRYQDPVLWVWYQILLTPKRYQYQNNTLTVTFMIFNNDKGDFFVSLPAQNVFESIVIFQLNTLKGIVKAPAEDHLRLITLRGTKTAFLTPRYMEIPPGLHHLVHSWKQPYNKYMCLLQIN